MGSVGSGKHAEGKTREEKLDRVLFFLDFGGWISEHCGEEKEVGGLAFLLFSSGMCLFRQCVERRIGERDSISYLFLYLALEFLRLVFLWIVKLEFLILDLGLFRA